MRCVHRRTSSVLGQSQRRSHSPKSGNCKIGWSTKIGIYGSAIGVEEHVGRDEPIRSSVHLYGSNRHVLIPDRFVVTLVSRDGTCGLITVRTPFSIDEKSSRLVFNSFLDSAVCCLFLGFLKEAEPPGLFPDRLATLGLGVHSEF